MVKADSGALGRSTSLQKCSCCHDAHWSALPQQADTLKPWAKITNSSPKKWLRFLLCIIFPCPGFTLKEMWKAVFKEGRLSEVVQEPRDSLSSGEMREPPSVVEDLRSTTFLGIVSWKESRCQLPNDPKGSAKGMWTQAGALGRHRSLSSKGATWPYLGYQRILGLGCFTKQGCREEGTGEETEPKAFVASSRWESPDMGQKMRRGVTKEENRLQRTQMSSWKRAEAKQFVVPA